VLNNTALDKMTNETQKTATSPSDCRISVITLWMSSRVVQYSPSIHIADRWILCHRAKINSLFNYL